LKVPDPASAGASAASATATICVRVRLFAAYREAARTNRLERVVPSGVSVADLRQLLAAEIPALGATPGLIAVNQEYVAGEHVLQEGDEVAFIPPVSGGC
jgi:molybdopterin synthase catalytic subunit